MNLQIFKKRADAAGEPTLFAAAEVLGEGDGFLEFQTPAYLNVELGVSYYLRRNKPERPWLRIQFSETTSLKPPYIYTAQLLRDT